VWGLTLALYEGTEFAKGEPRDTNLNSYRVLRMGDMPEIEIEFLPSNEAPVGLGEPSTTAVAPAIGNAIFAATGARVRHTPIRPEDVMAALQHHQGLS
jgi:isoquinoline 1-oxidoreductase beta subunit